MSKFFIDLKILFFQYIYIQTTLTDEQAIIMDIID